MQPAFRIRIRPIQVLPMGFLGVILLGALLLTLPAAAAPGKGPLPFLDALFTATSATCVTGLIVADTGTDFSLLGQVIIILLIQIGGLGFMSMATVFLMAMRKKISLKERMVIAEALSADRLQGVVGLMVNAMKLTFGVELIGAILLCLRFIPLFGATKGIWYAVFHSISAFCNAGFDLMGNYASLTAFRGDWLVNLVIMALVVTGGTGFAVLADVGHSRRFSKMRLQTKVVLCTNTALLLAGAVLVFLLERDNPATLGRLPAGEQVLASLFQSVTLRTAGFNTIDQLALRDATKLIGVLLMFIGASPASTGGGVKTTTIALLMMGVWSVVRNRPDVNAFRRRIPWATVRRAVAVTTILGAALLVTTIFISTLEANGPAGAMGLENILYETTSAFGTVGVSVGVTAAIGPASRCLLILGMFLGRVGPLTLMLSFAGKSSGDAGIRYPEGNLMIG